MAYRELAAISREQRIEIDGETYDVDYVGQDDGADPQQEPALRLILQLGRGLMIYLYVVGLAQPGQSGAPRALRTPTPPGRTDWFHTFWTKDCAVAVVDMEEHGPPDRVRCEPLVFPALHRSVAVEGVAWPIARGSFQASVTQSEKSLELRWELSGNGPRELLWSNVGGWQVLEQGRWRAVSPATRVLFSA